MRPSTWSHMVYASQSYQPLHNSVSQRYQHTTLFDCLEPCSWWEAVRLSSKEAIEEKETNQQHAMSFDSVERCASWTVLRDEIKDCNEKRKRLRTHHSLTTHSDCLRERC